MKTFKSSPGIASLAVMAVIGILALAGVSAFYDGNESDGNPQEQTTQDNAKIASDLMANIEAKLSGMEAMLDGSSEVSADAVVTDTASLDTEINAAADATLKAKNENQNVDSLLERLDAIFERRSAVVEKVLAKVPSNARSSIQTNFETRTQNFNELRARFEARTDTDVNNGDGNNSGGNNQNNNQNNIENNDDDNSDDQSSNNILNGSLNGTIDANGNIDLSR